MILGVTVGRARRPTLDDRQLGRLYDWALVDTTDPASSQDAQSANWLLIRRSIPRRGGPAAEYAFCRAHAPRPVPLNALVKVAGTRWQIAESFAGSKELAALDQYQVRGWTPWRRWTILAMLGHAFLSVMAAAQPMPRDGVCRDKNGRELIPLTRNEIRRPFVSLTCQPRPLRHQLHWSRWRRRHQAAAEPSPPAEKAASARRQAMLPPSP